MSTLYWRDTTTWEDEPYSSIPTKGPMGPGHDKPLDGEEQAKLNRLKKGITKAGHLRKDDGLRYQLRCVRAHIAAIERHTAELKANLNMASSILTKRRR